MPTLVIQRGHVPRKTGATGTEGEQAMAIAVAAEVVKQTRPGWTVKVIDADVPDASYRGDCFVAVHGDGSENRSARGASVGYRTQAGQVLARAWKDAYAAVGFPGGFRPDNYTDALSGYYGVKRAVAQGNTRAIIIEVGFMTNTTGDRAWIDANHDKIAASIWTAVAGPLAKEDDVNHTIEVTVRPEKEAALLKDLLPVLVKHGVYADALRINADGQPYRAALNPATLRTK